MMNFPEDSLIARIYDQDASNFEKAKSRLGFATLLPDDILKLYTLLHETAKPFLHTGVAETAAGLYVLCSKHLVLGTLALLRLHSTQAFRETRAAVECAGIAYVIQKDPEKYKVFVNDDGERPEARKVAKRTFRTDIIFPDHEPLVRQLRFHYESASHLSHTNAMTFRQHLSRGKTDSPLVLFNFQDINSETVDRVLPEMLILICMAHLDVLSASAAVFPEMRKNESFQGEWQQVLERVGRFREQFNSR
jgi:hypothetical protein